LKNYSLEIEGLQIQVAQKKIRNIHLRISPPDASINISAPIRVSVKKIRDFIISKITWIKEGQLKVLAQKKPYKYKCISGEIHYIFDDKYQLNLVENSLKNLVVVSGNEINLYVKKDTNQIKRQKILDEFYRNNLKKIIPKLIKEWEEKMKLKLSGFGIKKMKTRWGTCNIISKKIWINLELAKKPLACLEYIVVHEMVHLFEKNHNKKFYAHCDFFLPNWREASDFLKSKTIDRN
jgi:predicted metal-dependent hydrolase